MDNTVIKNSRSADSSESKIKNIRYNYNRGITYIRKIVDTNTIISRNKFIEILCDEQHNRVKSIVTGRPSIRSKLIKAFIKKCEEAEITVSPVDVIDPEVDYLISKFDSKLDFSKIKFYKAETSGNQQNNYTQMTLYDNENNSSLSTNDTDCADDDSANNEPIDNNIKALENDNQKLYKENYVLRKRIKELEAQLNITEDLRALIKENEKLEAKVSQYKKFVTILSKNC